MVEYSVIIPNFNGEKWLKECLSSIYESNKEIKDYFEVIIVDNASSDKSLDIVSQFFPDVLVVALENNFGFSTACNMGVKKSKGKYLVFVNSDTKMNSNTLSLLSDEIVSRDLDAIAALEVPYASSKNSSEAQVVTTIDIIGFPVYRFQDRSHNNFYLSAVCLLLLKETYLEVGGLDNNFFMYFEDIDFFWRMLLFEKSFDYSDTVAIMHAAHGSTSSNRFDSKRFLWRNENLLKMLLKNYRLRNLIWVIPLYALSCTIEIAILVLIGKTSTSSTYFIETRNVIRDRKIIFESRQIVQAKRRVSDLSILKRMYKGSGKLLSLKRQLL